MIRTMILFAALVVLQPHSAFAFGVRAIASDDSSVRPAQTTQRPVGSPGASAVFNQAGASQRLDTFNVLGLLVAGLSILVTISAVAMPVMMSLFVRGERQELAQRKEELRQYIEDTTSIIKKEIALSSEEQIEQLVKRHIATETRKLVGELVTSEYQRLSKAREAEAETIFALFQAAGVELTDALGSNLGDVQAKIERLAHDWLVVKQLHSNDEEVLMVALQKLAANPIPLVAKRLNDLWVADTGMRVGDSDDLMGLLSRARSACESGQPRIPNVD